MQKPAAPRHGPARRAALGALAALWLASAPALADAPSGLVPLPCGEAGPLRPADPVYCRKARHYVTPAAREALLRAAERVARERPGAVVRYMEASWPRGVRPMPPHRSHGDGRQIDLATFYEDRAGRALDRPPPAPNVRLLRGYGAYEPPQRETERVCAGGPASAPDPPAARGWRMDAARTQALIDALLAERSVRRIFLEPHLKRRLGYASDSRIRFAGCAAARHDDHLHVDFR
ncbi:hypothetical protein [Phenylobacterium sp.]|uniref:hypothetical protein n=1 Tax=Phenylobacterium sp. TaxID=1871053 RepID=UPI003D2A1B5B